VPPGRPPVGPPSGAKRPGERSLFGRLRGAIATIFPEWIGGSRRLHEFADLVAAARDPAQVEAALVAQAGKTSGASRVELVVDRDDGGFATPAHLVALWPEGARKMTPAEVEALGYPLCLGLWCGADYRMSLLLYARPGSGGRWPARVVRRLTTLCAVAAAALRGLHAGRRARRESAAATAAAVRDATFLAAILPYALSQADRHGEPLSVLCIEVDRLAELGRLHGLDAADRAVRRVAEAAAHTLRGSDVVARLDDDRVIVMLPNTGPAAARTVVGVVRSAIAAASHPVGGGPDFTASIGVASFPDDAHDSASLLAAADEATTRARVEGPKPATPPLTS